MIELLKALWPNPTKEVAESALTIWEMPGKESLHYPLGEVLKATQEDVDKLIDQLQGHCVYFGLGLRQPGLPSDVRGGKKHVNFLPGFALDIDMASDNGAHVADNLPRTEDDVDKLMEGAPEPTAIVHTGNGLHCYWTFPEPLKLTCRAERDIAAEAFEVFQQPFIDRAKELGWHLDKTASIDRVWRLPDFKNMKGTR